MVAGGRVGGQVGRGGRGERGGGRRAGGTEGGGGEGEAGRGGRGEGATGPLRARRNRSGRAAPAASSGPSVLVCRALQLRHGARRQVRGRDTTRRATGQQEEMAQGV